MKKIISIIAGLSLVISSLCVFAAFDDIDSATAQWAGEAIEYLSGKNVINGYEDGTFRPHGNVTRAEFAKMLSLVFELELTDAEYDDISLHWANEYIKSAADTMYTEGISFNPDSNASRADIAYAAAAVLGLEASDETVIERFADYTLVNQAMKANVVAAVEQGIILGYEDSTLRPDSPVSRAEAAVIIHRAINIRDTELPPSPEIPGENLPEQSLPSGEKQETEPEHIYTLYPGKDLLLISSVSLTSSAIDGEEAYRITYRMSNSEEEYTSVIPSDVEVKGIKSSISQLGAGDVIMMNTAFHGYIGYLYVFANFDGSVPCFDTETTSYGKGEYTLASGKLTNISYSGRAAILTVETAQGVTTETVLSTVETNVFSTWKKQNSWSLGDFGDIDLEAEDVYVFIRYTNSVSTDIIISDIIR